MSKADLEQVPENITQVLLQQVLFNSKCYVKKAFRDFISQR